MEDQQGPTKFIDPRQQEIEKTTTNIYNNAMDEFGLKMPLAFTLYNQIRYYEDFGKLKIGYSIQGKEALANQFGVSVKQIEKAYDHLTNTYHLGSWVYSDKPIFRRVNKIWISNVRQQRMSLEDTLRLLENSQAMGVNDKKLPSHGSKNNENSQAMGVNSTPVTTEVKNQGQSKYIESNKESNKEKTSEQVPPVFSFDVREGGPTTVGGTVGSINNSKEDKLESFIKKVLTEAGFNISNTNIREAKPSAKKALAEHVPIDDIMKAAKGIRQYEGDIHPTVRSAFKSTSFWMSQVQPEKPKGVWNG